MRIAVVAPVSNGSRIGANAVAIGEALQHQGHVVELLAPRSPGSHLPTSIPLSVCARGSLRLGRLELMEACLYAVGSESTDRRWALELAQAKPGFLILGDVAPDRPLLAAIRSSARGVICCRGEHATTIRRGWAGPVCAIPAPVMTGGTGRRVTHDGAELSRFIECALRTTPMLALADRVGWVLAEMGVSPDAETVRRIERHLQEMAGPEHDLSERSDAFSVPSDPPDVR